MINFYHSFTSAIFPGWNIPSSTMQAKKNPIKSFKWGKNQTCKHVLLQKAKQHHFKITKQTLVRHGISNTKRKMNMYSLFSHLHSQERSTEANSIMECFSPEPPDKSWAELQLSLALLCNTVSLESCCTLC